MTGMILSAGFGTRLKPLTNDLPKALVNHKGKPMIVHQINRLINVGVKEILVNAHHFAEKVEFFFNTTKFDVPVKVIKEKEILGTGGGIMNARRLLEKHPNFIVINVDVDTNFDLYQMTNAYNNEMAMLAVQKRNTSRPLAFNNDMELLGKVEDSTPEENKFGFNGIHIISSDIFKYNYPVKFSGIIEIYFDLLRKGEIIKGYDTGDCRFKDLGKPENLEN